MVETYCVLCAVYHPESDRHFPDRTQTCESGRRRLERDRLAVRSMYLRLMEEEQILADERTRGDDGPPCDPISAALPMAVTPGLSRKPSVSGSRERQLPINVNVVDLTAPAQIGDVVDTYGDQVGLLSVASTLWPWVDVWRQHLYHSPVAPSRDPLALLDWIGARLEALCEQEPAIGDFAEELTGLRGALRHALGEATPAPVVMWGVPCRRCDRVSTLVLDPEDPDSYRECTAAGCGVLMTEREYKDWLVEYVERLRAERDIARDTAV